MVLERKLDMSETGSGQDRDRDCNIQRKRTEICQELRGRKDFLRGGSGTGSVTTLLSQLSALGVTQALTATQLNAKVKLTQLISKKLQQYSPCYPSPPSRTAAGPVVLQVLQAGRKKGSTGNSNKPFY